MTTPTTPEALATLITEHFSATTAEPLIVQNLSERLYRQSQGVNVSSLKPLAESAKKYAYAQANPMPQTAAMIFGTCVHAMLLEPDRLAEMIVTRPPRFDSFRTNAAKEWRDSQTAMVVTAEDLDEMHAAAAAVKADPKAAWILQRAETEVAIWRRHDRTGLILKGRLDLPFLDLEEKTAVADIKKTTSVKPSLFGTAIGERLYHMQGAFYTDLIGASSFYFIAVEEKAPHECDIFKLSDRSMNDGRALYEALLTRLARCQAQDRWPGVSEDSETIREIDAPAWAYKAEDIL